MHEQKEVWRVSNDDAGIRDLVKKLKQLKPKLIVLEPTGGFEMLVGAGPACGRNRPDLLFVATR